MIRSLGIDTVTETHIHTHNINQAPKYYVYYTIIFMNIKNEHNNYTITKT